MNILERIKHIFSRNERGEPVLVTEPPMPSFPMLPKQPDQPDAWITIPCEVCGQPIEFHLEIDLRDVNPFNATVLTSQCPQCAERWAAIIPPVQIAPADSLSLKQDDMIHGD